MDVWNKISPYFKRKEFACKCGRCSQDVVDAELLSILNIVRECYGPIVITSGNRCPEHNERVGGASGSQHLTGKAADFRPLKSDPDFQEKLDNMHDMLLSRFPDTYGIAIGDTFVHIDTRTKPARWTY